MSSHTTLTAEGAAPVYPEWTLGDHLRKARITAGYREQRSFAAVLGISQGSVSNYEDDRTLPNELVLREWARICNVPRDYFPTPKKPATPARLDRRRPRRGSDQVERESRWTHGPRVIPFPTDRPIRIAVGQ